MFHQQMRKVFVNTYLFLINPTCFESQVSSSGSSTYAKITAVWI